MKSLLFVSNLFPDARSPVRGLDNATLLHGLRKQFGYEIRVIVPRSVLPPGRPLTQKILLHGRPGDETIRPTYLPTGYVPWFGSRWNDLLMARALRPSFARIVRDFKPDVVMASWLFPDGCAVAALCREAGLPLVLVTQGSDTHQYLTDPIRRRKILIALDTSEAVICRSGDLAKRLESAGAAPKKLEVIYNGIDPEVFFPQNQVSAREALGIAPSLASLLFVGNLLPVKDPLFLVRAHASLSAFRTAAGLAPTRLRFIGEGPLEGAIRREAGTLGTLGEIEFLGRRNSREVALWMNASDVLCLSSVNEGFPNVLLEAMACGLPIVSTDVGGIREKVNSPPTGRLVPPGDLEGYARALNATLGSPRPSHILEALTWEAAVTAYDRCLCAAALANTCRSAGSR